MSRYRYGPFDDGPDPLAAPFDVRSALDAVGERVLAGEDPNEALRELLRRGAPGRRGLESMRREALRRAREARRNFRGDGTLEEVRRLLEEALEAERTALFPDPSDDARFREARLSAVSPDQAARAVQELREYDWRSPEAAAAYQQIRDLLREEVLDSQFAGMKQALSQAGPEDVARVRDMLAELNELIAADERGELTQDRFDDFVARHSDFFPDNPQTLDELIDSLARRMAAAQRLMASLTPEQRAELGALAAGVLDDLGLSAEMARLSDALRSRRPDLDWDSPSRLSGDNPLGLGDATTAMAELADLEDLAASLSQDYPGADLDDVDEEAVRRALGRGALDDLSELRRIQRELEEQGWLDRAGGRLELTPKAIRRIGQAALRKVFSSLATSRRGGHEIKAAGAAGELTGSTRPWEFGDAQPLDVVRTLTNAIRRTAGEDSSDRLHTTLPPADLHPAGPAAGLHPTRPPAGPHPTRPPAGLHPTRTPAGPHPTRPAARIELAVEDFEVGETERRGRAAVSVLIDTSYSMALRDTWVSAKTTALALHALVTGMYPQDAVQLITFARYAAEITPAQLASLEPDYVQGTNLQHGLLLAGRFLDRHPGCDRIVLIVTDGEPTAHLTRDGQAWFDWPPDPETVALTYAQVDAMTKRRAQLSVFSLDPDPRLTAFCEEVARRNGGRVFFPDPERLGDYVVSDYLRRRAATSRRRAG
ncbi:MAG: VWA domain-containing protein [Sporichthyaceae bacterium]